jgi:hypothetical protein
MIELEDKGVEEHKIRRKDELLGGTDLDCPLESEV